MSDCCAHDACCAPDPHRGDPRWRRVLWIVLAINLAMFVVEVAAGLAAGSVSLQADALDFLGDAANYGVSLAVAGMVLRLRARAALIKGVTMALFGVWVIGSAAWNAAAGIIPEAMTMGVVGCAALAANIACFALLWSHRRGDANMRSVWLCTRNDVGGSLAVLAAAFGVFGTGTRWPDIAVAAIMAALALHSSFHVIRQSLSEIRARPVELSGAG